MLTRRHLVWVAVLGAMWLVLSFVWAFGSVDRARAHVKATLANYVAEGASSVMDASNSTLGFAKIAVLSMPDRTDKRDTLALAASITGIDVEWEDGVDGSKVNPKAIPDSWAREQSNGTYGCWRAHMNVLQKMVKERTPSMLVMEDDVDWDVNIKALMVEFARGTKWVLGQENVTTHSPYGDGWDVLWVGHCGARNMENIDQRYYVIRDDPTAIPQALWGFPRRQPNFTPHQLNGTFNRVIYRPVRGLCTGSYAISLRGAQRFLQDQALEEALVSDRALNKLCTRNGGSCIVPYPALIGTHKAAGSMSKDSDREQFNDAVREVGETRHVVFSTKLNFKQLIPLGKDTIIKSQWPDKTLLKTANRTMAIPRGEGVFVRRDEYSDFPRPN